MNHGKFPNYTLEEIRVKSTMAAVDLIPQLRDKLGLNLHLFFRMLSIALQQYAIVFPRMVREAESFFLNPAGVENMNALINIDSGTKEYFMELRYQYDSEKEFVVRIKLDYDYKDDRTTIEGIHSITMFTTAITPAPEDTLPQNLYITRHTTAEVVRGDFLNFENDPRRVMVVAGMAGSKDFGHYCTGFNTEPSAAVLASLGYPKAAAPEGTDHIRVTVEGRCFSGKSIVLSTIAKALAAKGVVHSHYSGYDEEPERFAAMGDAPGVEKAFKNIYIEGIELTAQKLNDTPAPDFLAERLLRKISKN